MVYNFPVLIGDSFSVVWSKGLRDITESLRSLRFTSDDYTRFTLKRATVDDIGTYCILAKNMYGCDRAFFTVRLRHRARSLSPTKESASSILADIPTYLERCQYQGKLWLLNH